jgi:hypothetical protein
MLQIKKPFHENGFFINQIAIHFTAPVSTEDRCIRFVRLMCGTRKTSRGRK